MNAAVVFLTSAWMAGADVAPPAVPAPAPAPMAAAVAPIGGCANGGCATGGCGSGCGAAGCSGAYDECPNSGRPNLMSKLKGKFSGHGGGCSSCGGGYSAPAPVYTGFTTSGCDTCDPCSKHGGGLFSKLKAKFSKGSDCGCTDPCATGGCGSAAPAGCALPPAPGAVMPPPATTPPPAPMPTPPKTPEAKPKTTQITIPPVVTPVSGPRVAPPLGGSGSPF